MIRRIGRRTFACRIGALLASLGTVHLPGVTNAQQRASPRRIGVLFAAFSRESKEVHARGYETRVTWKNGMW